MPPWLTGMWPRTDNSVRPSYRSGNMATDGQNIWLLPPGAEGIYDGVSENSDIQQVFGALQQQQSRFAPSARSTRARIMQRLPPYPHSQIFKNVTIQRPRDRIPPIDSPYPTQGHGEVSQTHQWSRANLLGLGCISGYARE
jgi:hypothetical protein